MTVKYAFVYDYVSCVEGKEDEDERTSMFPNLHDTRSS